jgi:hypothetical protein
MRRHYRFSERTSLPHVPADQIKCAPIHNRTALARSKLRRNRAPLPVDLRVQRSIP